MNTNNPPKKGSLIICLNNTSTPSLTVGKAYQVFDALFTHTPNTLYLFLQNDDREFEYYRADRFELAAFSEKDQMLSEMDQGLIQFCSAAPNLLKNKEVRQRYRAFALELELIIKNNWEEKK